MSDHDFRWEIIEQSVDCRTAEERDDKSPSYIPKSRYSTVSRYISNHEYVKDHHNDLADQKVCPQSLDHLLKQGLDMRLAIHISSIFSRSPIPVYEREIAFPCCQAHDSADQEDQDEEVKQDNKDNDDSVGSPQKISQNGEIDHADLEKTTDSSSYIRVNSISE